MKRKPVPTCSWCGAKLSASGRGCPRGPFCAAQEQNHYDLMTAIANTDDTFAGKLEASRRRGAEAVYRMLVAA